MNTQLFFEGVKSLIASGTKPDEVGFRLDFSKAELRKCIKEYPGKEVRRCGLRRPYLSPHSSSSIMHTSAIHLHTCTLHIHTPKCTLHTYTSTYTHSHTYTLAHIHTLKVKKGLDKLYHKMEKDMSDTGQLEVTWGIMQKAFMQQFKEFEDLIEKCYPGSSITLEFTIEDLTNYISQAKSTQQ